MWEAILGSMDGRLAQRNLEQPIVIALDTPETNHYQVIGWREILTVTVTRVIGHYPNGKYEYTYPGVTKAGFYHAKGKGIWFSGTLVVGDAIMLSEPDMRWMRKEGLYFRIKRDRNAQGEWDCRAYDRDFAPASLRLI
jgi:hypothetical protein